MATMPPPHRALLLAPLLAALLAGPPLLAQETPAPPEKEQAPPEATEEEPEKPDLGYAEVELLARAIETIRQSYVDEEKTSYENLMAGALEGMLASLDPHCEYMRETLFEQMQRHQSNTYDGVGITISLKRDSLTIVTVREDGAAARAGVMPEDQIIKIGDVHTAKVGLAEAVGLLDGKPGETLNIVVLRPSTGQLMEFEMVREVMLQDSVRDAILLPASMAGDRLVGYVRILQFNDPTAREFAEALDRLEEEGMEALVLDLRNNPGGLLNSAVDVCGEFLPEDTVVVTTPRGRAASATQPPYRTGDRGGRPQRSYPVAVLINVGSASGSEIVAGALQDLKRAIVVGETSFGKGSVQSVIPMAGGGAMRLTTAKYYTPSKKVIHEQGVSPNITVPLSPKKERELAGWRSKPGRGGNLANEIAGLGDTQLERAVDALKGVLVLRGPDR